MLDNDNKRFVEIEDELNAALGRIGESKETEEASETMEEKTAALTVQELLEQIKIDEFEKIYITTAAQSSSPSNVQIPEEKMGEVKTLAEYELEQKEAGDLIPNDEEEKLKAASNYYIIPRTVEQRVNVGAIEERHSVDIYTVNDVEGYSLYTIIDNQTIAMTSGFIDRIKKYIEETYPMAIATGMIKEADVIEHFTPHSMIEMYDMLTDDKIITMRMLPDRIDEFVEEKGVVASKNLGIRQLGVREANLAEYDDLEEKSQIASKDNSEQNQKQKPEPEQTLEKDEGETLEEPDQENGKVKDGASIRLIEDKEEKEEEFESYIEKIARINHVKPAVVNTRVIENFEKVEEDTGIPLRGLNYKRGEVIAVRIPYKLSYRTFLVDKNTGMTIDGKGRKERRPGILYDFDEIEEYFRFKLRDGHDGGEDGKPLRYDEGRDYTTYIDENGELKEQKFINNGKKQDMLREERERYLTEVAEADQKLKEAIDEYQKHSTHENYEKVRDIIKLKVEIDNKYNALDEQRQITKLTKENAEKVMERDLDDDDDDWFPGGPRFFH